MAIVHSYAKLPEGNSAEQWIILMVLLMVIMIIIIMLNTELSTKMLITLHNRYTNAK